MHQEGRAYNLAGITRQSLLREQDYREDYKSYSSESKVPELEKFTKDHKWKQFRDLFRNHLDGIRGAKQIPLSYVIRPDVPPQGYDPLDPIYTTELAGHRYNQDNRKVFTILEKAVLGGPGDTYITDYKSTFNGRGAFIALDRMFTGEGLIKYLPS